MVLVAVPGGGAVQLSFADNYLQWDNTEPVTYRSVRKTGEMVDTIPIARRRKLTVKDMATGVVGYQTGDIAWLVPQALLSPSLGRPKEADIIVDQLGRPWTVLTADGQSDDSNGPQTWRLTCRNVVIAFDLKDTVTIERAVSNLDASGTDVRTWQPLYSGITCRLQPVDQDIATERGITDLQGKYLIYLSQEVQVVMRDRVNVGAKAPGGYLEILSYRNRERIDELPYLECKLAV